MVSCRFRFVWISFRRYNTSILDHQGKCSQVVTFDVGVGDWVGWEVAVTLEKCVHYLCIDIDVWVSTILTWTLWTNMWIETRGIPGWLSRDWCQNWMGCWHFLVENGAKMSQVADMFEQVWAKCGRSKQTPSLFLYPVVFLFKNSCSYFFGGKSWWGQLTP